VKNHAGVGDSEMLQHSPKSESEYGGEGLTRRRQKGKQGI